MAEMITMKLGPLAAKLGQNTRQIQRIVDEGLAPKPIKKGEYNVWEVTRGLIRYYQDKAAKVSESRAADAARSAKADAESKEIELGRLKRTICSRDDFKNCYADAVAQGVRAIGRIKGLSKAQKDLVFAAIRDVKLAEPEEEK